MLPPVSLGTCDCALRVASFPPNHHIPLRGLQPKPSRNSSLPARCPLTISPGRNAGHRRRLATHRGTIGPPGRRIIALGGCATSGRFAGPRDRAAPLASRSCAHHPQVLARADPSGRPRGRRRDGAADAPVPRSRGPRSREHHRQRRRRQWQDHVARRPQRVHPRRRTPDHHRGRRRAPPRETARGLPRSTPGQRRRARAR